MSQSTNYAPAERELMEKVRKQFHFLQNADYIEKIIDSLPYMGAILNRSRQVIFANNSLLNVLGLRKIEGLLGKRPGEILHCVNAGREIGGCGTSEHCSVCGAVNSILEAQESNRQSSKECRIVANNNGDIVAYDFLATTSPFRWKEHDFFIFSLTDISSEKRRRALEKIFFHDVINKTGSMTGFIDLLKAEKNLDKIYEFIDYVAMINHDLTSEIMFHRDLSAAESGELMLETSPNNSLDILKSTARQISMHEVAISKNIHIDDASEEFLIHTDGVLLRRVLTNLIKNALEATPVKGIVTISTQPVNDKFRFQVHNQSVIPQKDQLQIFQRSFSTKGRNRGLGTYSVKLLGENYLKGEVGFESNEKAGTTFHIILPASI